MAGVIDRDCVDVCHKYQYLHASLPPYEPISKMPIRAAPWYDRFKKEFIGDWDHTRSHEHDKRELTVPCSHEGPCTEENLENCPSQGKTCFSKQKDRPCICVQLHRESDPDLCGTCGVLMRADPENAEDELLHATGCQNCSLQRGPTKALVLGQSQLEGVGYGVFTAEFITQGDFIIEYVGELISHGEGVRREARRGGVFDEESNISRYINHASKKSAGDKCGCNITPQILYVNGEYRIMFTAMRDIQAGEELFFDYGENFPNLTKKLLGHKTKEIFDAAKKGTRQPNRADSGQGVARKLPSIDKRKPGKGEPVTRQDLEDENFEPPQSGGETYQMTLRTQTLP
ncbi:hypothetical protein FANTH_4550 [Fusarium anthophilum]|uniref:SET domain-containing protein n=1 Tax=Fusarium anthophilum TaxID=48485 RepID=A0A8H4ZPX4_9HYPO|nr:hypothetical protein FANTH_4550 [Fusarium anthophilum]